MTQALMNSWTRLQKICALCKVPLENVATHGGWSPHLCHDRMNSRAFDTFLSHVMDPFPRLEGEDGAKLLRFFYLRMPPWERPVALKILEHAGVNSGG